MTGQVVQFRRAPSPEFIMALAEILRRQKNQLALIETVHLVNELKSRVSPEAPRDREAVDGLPPFQRLRGEP